MLIGWRLGNWLSILYIIQIDFETAHCPASLANRMNCETNFNVCMSALDYLK